MAKIFFGELHQSCTGALVEGRWVVTAKSCFSDGSKTVEAGAPSRATTVVVGRTSLSGKSGHRLSVVSLVPHPQRDIVLAELSAPVKDITAVALDGDAPREGETLRIAGYGRTGTEWVPDRLHAGTFTAGALATETLAVVADSSGSTVCRGDAGGPAFREGATGSQLLGIAVASGQKGCLGEPEASTDASVAVARTDDLGDWIRSTTAVLPNELREPVTGEFNRDGIQDLIATDATGKLWLYPGTATPNAWGARVKIGSGYSSAYREFTVGRVDRDAFDDLLTIETATGILWMYPGTAAGGAFGARLQWGSGWNDQYRDLAIGKVDRDAYDDLLAVHSSTQRLLLYRGNAEGKKFDEGITYGSGWSCCKQLNVGKFDDDDYDDLLTVVSGTGKMWIYPGTAAGTQFGQGVDANAGTAWNSSSFVVKGKFDDTGLDGLLGVDSTTAATWLYPRTATAGWAPRIQPSGKAYAPQPFELKNIVTGKFDRDSHTDLIGVDSAGLLWMHPGTAANTFEPRVRIGSGYTGYREFAVGRVNRDAYDDLLTIETATGILWMYPGTAAGGAFGARLQWGSGWNDQYRDLAIGKVDRDAYDDLLAVHSSTQRLLLYRGNAEGKKFDEGITYGSGWSCCKELTLGKYNDDEYDDLQTVVSATGKMWIYPGTAAGTQFGTGVDAGAGSGWLEHSELNPVTFGNDARSGLLSKNTEGALVLHPVGRKDAIDWSDPVVFGPRD